MSTSTSTILKVKRNDTAVVFTDTLLINAVPVDLSGATVKFILRKGNDTFAQPAAIVSAPAGTVSFGPAALPTDVGKWLHEWEVTFSDASVLTFPNDQYNAVEVLADLG